MRPTDQISDPSWQDILDRDKKIVSLTKEVQNLQERVAFAEEDRDKRVAEAAKTVADAEDAISRNKQKSVRTGEHIRRVVNLGRDYAEGKLSLMEVAGLALKIAQDLGAPVPPDGAAPGC